MLETPPDTVVSSAGDPSDWLPFGHLSWFSDSHMIYRCTSTERSETVMASMASAPTWWPEVVVADGVWIVTTRPAGEGAHEPERHGQIGGLAELAGRTLRELHDIPVSDAIYPVVDGEASRVGWSIIADRVAESDVVTETLPEPFSRYDRDRLLELWRESRPATEELVMCHGRPRLQNLFVAATEFGGWVEPRQAVIADRHLDLAIAHRSIQDRLGNDAVFLFHEAYGSDPSLVALEHYLLADLLMR